MKSFFLLLLTGLAAWAATFNYSYDDAGRLTGISSSDGQHLNYAYDLSGNLVSRTSGAIADTDGDNMDDAWEISFFGNLSRNGTADFDNDSMPDLHEFVSGTNPTNSSSRLIILTTQSDLRPPAPTVVWTGVSGKRYRLQYKNSLSDSQWQDVPGEITASSDGAQTKQDTTASNPRRFYRIIVLP